MTAADRAKAAEVARQREYDEDVAIGQATALAAYHAHLAAARLRGLVTDNSEEGQ